MKKTIHNILLLTSIFFLSSCSEDIINDPVNEEELITDVIITMVNTDDVSDVAVFSYSDPDGDAGSMEPVITGDSLRSGANYRSTIDLFDKSKSPADTVNHEILEEADAHRFDYTLEGSVFSKIGFAITDKDDNNLPLGLEFSTTVTATSPASGTLHVTLNHFDKVAKGLTNTDETDIAISYPISIY